MPGRLRWLNGALVGGMLSATLIAALYFGDQVFRLPFLPYDVFDWLARILPGALITFGIDRMVDVLSFLDVGPLDDAAKTAERLQAVLLFFALGLVAGALFFGLVGRLKTADITRRSDQVLALGLGLGLLLGSLLLLLSSAVNVSSTAAPLLSAAWIMLLFLTWGAALGSIYNRLAGGLPGTTDSSRRSFMIQVGGATATLTVVSVGLGELLKPYEEEIVGGDVDLSGLRNEAALTDPAPGTRPEYTPLQDHYRIDINAGRPPQIEEAEWRLAVNGMVAKPGEFSLAELREGFTPFSEFVTLSCISNRIAGDLISTTQWTGLRMQDFLEAVQPEPEATHIRITSVDGFFEYLVLDLIAQDERIMLAYEWDGVPLPKQHGFPLRIWIPDRYGMKQPKWISEMSFVDEWDEGYWVRRGWSREAIVNATSVVDTVAVDDVYERAGQRYVPIGGIAYAGARGISRVELSIDEGEWLEATLREPLSETTWVLWRYDWPFEAGEHRVAVRCYEGNGEMQISSEQGVRPDGATGIHSRRADL